MELMLISHSDWLGFSRPADLSIREGGMYGNRIGGTVQRDQLQLWAMNLAHVLQEPHGLSSAGVILLRWIMRDAL